MRRNVFTGTCLLALCLLWGCRDSVGGILQEVSSYQGQDVAVGEGSVPVQILLEGTAAARTIAPEHLTPDDLGDPRKYTLTMDGRSDMGDSVTVPNFTLRDGRGILALSPGAWTLRLIATDVATSTQFLSGSTLLIVQDSPTAASITLTPLTGTGTVRVQFVLPPSVVSRLDPQGNNTKQVTAALYDTIGTTVAGTSQTFTVTPGTAATPLTYTANAMQVPSGRYTLLLSAPYTVNNASTGNQNVTYNMGWRDILYVEHSRESSAMVNIPEAGTAMGVPDNPYRRDKVTASGNSPANQFNRSEAFNPWRETLWLYGESWDGSGNDTNGNEILVVDWDDVYNADYYEVEVLVHPFTKNASPATANGKFDRVVTTDAAWEALKRQQFTRSTQQKTPSYMRYSGAPSDPDYYKTRSYVISCNDGVQFLSCADKNLAKTLFTGNGAAAGKANAGYRISGTSSFDTYGTYSYRGVDRGKVGLEQGCGVIGILVPSFSPQTSLVYRVRAVNQYGHSDWVYWKGGKW